MGGRLIGGRLLLFSFGLLLVLALDGRLLQFRAEQAFPHDGPELFVIHVDGLKLRAGFDEAFGFLAVEQRGHLLQVAALQGAQQLLLLLGIMKLPDGVGTQGLFQVKAVVLVKLAQLGCRALAGFRGQLQPGTVVLARSIHEFLANGPSAEQIEGFARGDAAVLVNVKRVAAFLARLPGLEGGVVLIEKIVVRLIGFAEVEGIGHVGLVEGHVRFELESRLLLLDVLFQRLLQVSAKARVLQAVFEVIQVFLIHGNSF